MCLKFIKKKVFACHVFPIPITNIVDCRDVIKLFSYILIVHEMQEHTLINLNIGIPNRYKVDIMSFLTWKGMCTVNLTVFKWWMKKNINDHKSKSAYSVYILFFRSQWSSDAAIAAVIQQDLRSKSIISEHELKFTKFERNKLNC